MSLLTSYSVSLCWRNEERKTEMVPSSASGARSSPVAGLRTVKPGPEGSRSGGQGIGVGRGDALLAFAAGAHPHLKSRHSTYPLTLVPAPYFRLGRSTPRQLRKPGHSRVPSAARLAQSVEHETLILRVVGSSPTLGVVFAACCGFQCHVCWFLLPAVHSRLKSALLEAQGADINRFLLTIESHAGPCPRLVCFL